MTNDTRRLDASGYVQQSAQANGRDPRLQPQPAQPGRVSVRPAPPAMALPQEDHSEYYDAGAPYEEAPPTNRAQARPGAATSVPEVARADVDENVVHFTKSYMAHGQPVDRITLRKPVTRDIRKAGTPFKVILEDDQKTVRDVEYRWDAVASYVSMLSEPTLPPSTVDSLEFEDLARCAGVLVGFFLGMRTSN